MLFEERGNDLKLKQAPVVDHFGWGHDEALRVDYIPLHRDGASEMQAALSVGPNHVEAITGLAKAA